MEIYKNNSLYRAASHPVPCIIPNNCLSVVCYFLQERWCGVRKIKHSVLYGYWKTIHW